MSIDLLQAIQAGGQLALVAIAAHLIRIDRRVLRLEIHAGIDPSKASKG